MLAERLRTHPSVIIFNYRILTPLFRELRAFMVKISRPANYLFLTPQKKDSEFRIPLSEWFRRDAKWRRQKRVVGMTPRWRKTEASETGSVAVKKVAGARIPAGQVRTINLELRFHSLSWLKDMNMHIRP
jgi:hypothetical protein